MHHTLAKRSALFYQKRQVPLEDCLVGIVSVMQSAETAFKNYQKCRYFGSLDGLRCFCIALVLWHHREQIVPDGVELPMILSRGFTGVDFFFVLSGFLITTLLLREEARNGRFSLAGFYRRRILRIVPVYFLVVATAAVWWIGARGQEQWWALLPYYFAFLANFLEGDIPLLAPTWSLSVEEQFYMVWPLLMLLLPVSRLRIPLLLALSPLIYLTAQGLLPQAEIYRNEVLHVRLPDAAYGALLLGALMAITLHHQRGFSTLWVLLGRREAPLVLFLALCLAWQLLPGSLLGWPSLVMHALMAAILASITMREDHILAPLLRCKPIARIGVISYGLYLWHLFGLHIGNEVSAALGFQGIAANWVAMPIYILASVTIAELSFRYFESYFLNMRHPKEKRAPV